MLLEEPPVVFGQQRAVGRDREGDLRARGLRPVPRACRVAARNTCRLTSGSPPRNARLRRAPGSADRHQQIDRAKRLGKRHVLRRRRRTRPAGRSSRCSRDCTSARSPATAREPVAAGAARRRSTAARRGPPAAADPRLVAVARAIAAPKRGNRSGSTSNSRLPSATNRWSAELAFDQMGLRRPRRRGAHVAPCSARLKLSYLSLLGPAESSRVPSADLEFQQRSPIRGTVRRT